MFNISKGENVRDLIKVFEDAVKCSQKDYLTIAEACRILGVSRTFLYDLRTRGDIESILIGRKKVVILKSSIDTFVQSQKTAA